MKKLINRNAKITLLMNENLNKWFYKVKLIQHYANNNSHFHRSTRFFWESYRARKRQVFEVLFFENYDKLKFSEHNPLKT